MRQKEKKSSHRGALLDLTMLWSDLGNVFLFKI